MESSDNKKTELYSKLRSLVENDKVNVDKQKQNVLKKLPQSFWQFTKQRGIQIDEVLIEVPRFIRLKPPQLNLISQKAEKQQLPSLKQKIQHLSTDLSIYPNQLICINPLTFALAPSCKINHSKLYEQGKLYGMDISSMFAVKCLDLQKGNEVLELCSAPGNKSMFACDLIAGVKVTGVQINQNRANVMRNLINKYGLSERIDIVVEDATKFQPGKLFDRVLVDAQCTHEGSVKHLKKFTSSFEQQTKQQKKQAKNKTKQQQKQLESNHNPYMSLYDKKNQWTVQDFQKRFLDPVKLSNLHDLQLGLIKNGFRLLKENGIMVYSTCSIDPRQNQQIVEELLKAEPEAQLLDASESLHDSELFFRKGMLKETAYFTPKVSMCGGMFISKIKKISVKNFGQTQIQTQKQEKKIQEKEN